MVCLQRAQRRRQIRFGALTAALRRFCSQKNVLAERRQHRSINLFRFPVPVNARRIEIIDAKFIGPQGNRLRFFESTQGKPPAGLANDGQLLTGFSESALRYVPRFCLCAIGAPGESTQPGSCGSREKSPAAHSRTSGSSMLPAPVAFKVHHGIHPFAGDRNRLYAQRVRILYWITFVVLLCAPAAHAQKSTGVGAISWSPLRLQSGSPVLFTIQLEQPAGGVQGTWLKHATVFNKSRNGNTWYALAGIDVEQAPGTYPLELTVTTADGRQLHTSQEIAVLPAQYKTTTLHVQEKYVQPDAATLQRIAADKVVKDAAFAHQITQPLWSGSFRSA